MKYFKSNLFIVLVTTQLLVSCETKEYADQTPAPSMVIDGFDGKLSSDLSFTGITSVGYYDDTTASLLWSDISTSGAVEYHIFDISSGAPILIEKVLAPNSSITLRNLKSNESYEFIVRAKDEDGILEDNTNSISITTLSIPIDVPYFEVLDPDTFLPLSSVTQGFDKTPTFGIYGVNVGDTVSLYSDVCVTKVGEGIVKGSSLVYITTDELSPNSYTFYAERTNINGASSGCSSYTKSYEVTYCPSGYVSVDANPYLGNNKFCVMKYEAKAWYDSDNDNRIESSDFFDLDGCEESTCTTKNWGTGFYKPGSIEDHKPWRNIDIATAQDACQKLGDDHDLITNNEWMAIAAEIESITSNWSSGTVGTGCIFTGNVGILDACGYSGGAIDEGSGRDTKAELELASGETIFDLSGNVSEWVNWDESEDVTFGPLSCDDTWKDFNEEFCDGSENKYDYLPFNPGLVSDLIYDSTYGIGKIEGGTGGIALRGGGYQFGKKAGVYSLSLVSTPASYNLNTGFRCVYRP